MWHHSKLLHFLGLQRYVRQPNKRFFGFDGFRSVLRHDGFLQRGLVIVVRHERCLRFVVLGTIGGWLVVAVGRQHPIWGLVHVVHVVHVLYIVHVVHVQHHI
jgi:hypothetical protein